MSERSTQWWRDGLERFAGVLHVCSAAQDSDGWLRCLRIDQTTPKSKTDFSMLQHARDLSQHIVITGQILRDEPELMYPKGPAIEVLSSGRGLDPRHPVFTQNQARLVSDRRGVAWGQAHDLRTLCLAEPSLRQLLDELLKPSLGEPRLSEPRDTLISVEAGPKTARQLYEDGAPDQLWLGVFEGPIHAAQLTGPLVHRDRLRAAMRCAAQVRVREESGPWRFERWIRRTR